jgi:phosphoglucomutase/phosphopentomutase
MDGFFVCDASGYDGRHNSKRFAELTAATFLHQDIPVYLFDTTIPTPLVV